MGIKELNQYFIKHCSKEAIDKIHLNNLKNKVIVIDASIFIYRFLGEIDGLIPNMYNMISILLSYKIIPIFIFDGKTPIEKRPLVNRRRVEKKEAAEKYNNLIAQAENVNVPVTKKELEKLRKKCIQLTYTDLDNTKVLLDAFGISYTRANGEADALCALLVKRGLVWGAMSDDMDLFLYGCERVLRYLNLRDHTITLYNTNVILHEIGIIESVFVESVVMNGTDYNNSIENLSLQETICKARTKPEESSLYDIFEIEGHDREILYKICKIFHIDDMVFDENMISLKPPVVKWEKVQEFLKEWGFIFM